MGTQRKQNKTTFVRCDKDEQHPFCRVPAELFKLNGYQLAIMCQIISNNDDWNIVKYEISKRVGFPRQKFNDAWKSLSDLGYIKVDRIQGGYDYTIYEDLSVTSTTAGICEHSTSTAGRTCAGGTLTTIKINYNNTEESFDKSVNKSVKEVTTMIPDEQNSNLHKEFVELNKLYPNEVIRPDGCRAYLKSDRRRCEELYIAYLKERLLSHDEVMNCLKTELQVRNQNGKMKYIKRFVKWLSDREFEGYKDMAIEPVLMPYGTELM